MLPKINAPIYELELPISKIKTKFRPFLVKEQKLLMLSQQTEDSEFVENNVKQIIKNCCLVDINVEDLSQIDVEYFFINLRARSIGEVINAKYRCNNKIGDEVCGNSMQVDVNLLDVSVDFKENSDIIQLTDDIGIKMSYPDIKSLQKIDRDKDILSITLDVIYNCINYIFDEDNFYYKNETPKSEFIEFLEQLSLEQFKKIEDYFNNLPVLKEEIKVTCSSCGFKHNITITGLENFLG